MTNASACQDCAGSRISELSSDNSTQFLETVVYGWICPLCGHVISPHVYMCPNHDYAAPTRDGAVVYPQDDDV